MIAKPLDLSSARNEYERAGFRARRRVAEHINQLFGNDDRMRVLHDLRLLTARRPLIIDHLIVHDSGILMIENRSEEAMLEVSPLGQWTQHFNGKTLRISSPVDQLDRKSQLLKVLIDENTFMLRDHPHTFADFPVAALVTMSESEDLVLPPQVTFEQVCRPQTLAVRLKKEVSAQRRAARGLFGLTRREAHTLKQDELFRLTAFLRAQHEPLELDASVEALKLSAQLRAQPVCEACRGSNLYVKHQEGYFFACFDCGHKTAISRQCRACKRRGYIRQDGQSYLLECEHCLATQPIYERQLERVQWL